MQACRSQLFLSTNQGKWYNCSKCHKSGFLFSTQTLRSLKKYPCITKVSSDAMITWEGNILGNLFFLTGIASRLVSTWETAARQPNMLPELPFCFIFLYLMYFYAFYIFIFLKYKETSKKQVCGQVICKMFTLLRQSNSW